MYSAAARSSVAEVVARYLVSQEVARIYGLVGGHIQPIWDAVARAGIRVVDVRHEGSAVHMAHAEAELTGRVGVAIVTAGPGLTNSVTAIANASVSRIPILVISGRPPRPQAGMGAMQEIPQVELVRPVMRQVATVSDSRHILEHLDMAYLAALGADGTPGPSYIDFPTDLLTELVHPANVLPLQLRSRELSPMSPNGESLEAARLLIGSARRPLLIAGRSVHSASDSLLRYLELSKALYLDTGESRGAISYDHPSYVPAMRARAMKESDLVITVGRKLDYQLGYGSPAVFSPAASFLRIGRSSDETAENRRGDVELRADAASALEALVYANAVPNNLDRQWLASVQTENKKRQERLTETMVRQSEGADGRVHPYCLIKAIDKYLDEQSILIMDGGDILSFARVGLRAVRSLDCGAFGCLGVGVPFATAAAISHPDKKVIAVIGDGAFGFTAMEVSTAVRHQAKVLLVIANNAAWNIDRHDQLQRYGGHLVGAELPDHRYDLLAQSLGLYAETVNQADGLDEAIRRGLKNAPALLNVQTSREPMSADFTNGLAEVPPYQALSKWNQLELERYQ